MTERNLVINGIEIHYTGVFLLEELLDFFPLHLKQLGYEYQEQDRNEQMDRGEGKNLFMEIWGIKPFTWYVELRIKTRVTLTNIQNTTVLVNNIPRTYQKGDVSIILDGWTTTDFEGRWISKPWYFFVTALISKYIWPLPEPQGEGMIAADTRKFAQELRSFLNLYRYKVEKEGEHTSASEKVNTSPEHTKSSSKQNSQQDINPHRKHA